MKLTNGNRDLLSRFLLDGMRTDRCRRPVPGGRAPLLANMRSIPWLSGEDEARALRQGFADSPDFWQQLWWAVLIDMPLGLQNIDCPVVLAQGTVDVMSSIQTPRYLAFIPQSRFQPLVGAGHAPQSDAPRTILRLVAEATAAPIPRARPRTCRVLATLMTVPCIGAVTASPETPVSNSVVADDLRGDVGGRAWRGTGGVLMVRTTAPSTPIVQSGPSATSAPRRKASRIPARGPSPDQRRCRFAMVFQLPNAGGTSRHGTPHRVRQNIPLSTVR